ncbi:MAG: hypothetical protein HYR76_09900 [Ignavibacteria bacterium]|nr:hypothetical protein [Ignavibacteria bacterium]
MQNHNILYSIATVMICAFLTSCASTRAPSGWLPDADQARSSMFGGWVEIKSRQGQIWGELIAVSDDTVFVADTTLRAITSTEILSARLVTYDGGGLMGLSVLLGTLSTISNGGFLILTAPMWLIGGSIAATSRSYDPIIDYPAKPLKQFVPFARYPQGLPPNIDRTTVKMRSGK